VTEPVGEAEPGSVLCDISSDGCARQERRRGTAAPCLTKVKSFLPIPNGFIVFCVVKGMRDCSGGKGRIVPILK